MPPDPAPTALTVVAAAGDYRATLEALRGRLAVELDRTKSAREVASLSARLCDVLALIAGLPADVKGTPLDDLASRRAGRGATAPRKARPSRSG